MIGGHKTSGGPRKASPTLRGLGTFSNPTSTNPQSNPNPTQHQAHANDYIRPLE